MEDEYYNRMFPTTNHGPRSTIRGVYDHDSDEDTRRSMPPPLCPDAPNILGDVRPSRSYSTRRTNHAPVDRKSHDSHYSHSAPQAGYHDGTRHRSRTARSTHVNYENTTGSRPSSSREWERGAGSESRNAHPAPQTSTARPRRAPCPPQTEWDKINFAEGLRARNSDFQNTPEIWPWNDKTGHKSPSEHEPRSAESRGSPGLDDVYVDPDLGRGKDPRHPHSSTRHSKSARRRGEDTTLPERRKLSEKPMLPHNPDQPGFPKTNNPGCCKWVPYGGLQVVACDSKEKNAGWQHEEDEKRRFGYDDGPGGFDIKAWKKQFRT